VTALEEKLRAWLASPEGKAAFERTTHEIDQAVEQLRRDREVDDATVNRPMGPRR
jgi:hypothetical protein